VLAVTGVLVQQAPPEPQQHDKARRKRRLNHHERHHQQRRQLQRPAEHRDACAKEPACPADQIAREAEAQVLGVRRALGVHRLYCHP